MARNNTGVSKKTARESARKTTATKIAQGKRHSAGSSKTRKRVDSSDEESDAELDGAPPAKKRRTRSEAGQDAVESQALEEDGLVIVGEGKGAEEGDEGGEEDDTAENAELSDEDLLSA